MEGSEHTTAPTADELEKATEVSSAAAEAIAGSSTEEEARSKAREAVKSKSEEVKLEISEEDCNRIVDMMIERMSALGAFDPPPPPAAPSPASSESSAATPPPPPEQTAVEPEKRTFAERFAGLG
jgi:hypothetical protein